MRHTPSPRSRIWAVASAAVLMASTVEGQAPAPSVAPKVDPVVAALVEAHNKERAKENLPPLKLAPLLEEAARGHAKDMADRDKMSHDGTDGSTPQQRIVRAGYHYLTAGENVANGYGDVKKVMQGWMDSPPHKTNVLGDFDEIGVARVYAEDGKPYWCADFGRPMPKFDPATAATDLLKKLNEERSTAKLPSLAVDTRLAKAAGDQAVALARKKGEGGTPTSFSEIDARKYQELAMTTAVGQPTSEAVIKTLLDSPDHKAKLLGKFTKLGVGYATGEDGTPFWCIILGLPARR